MNRQIKFRVWDTVNEKFIDAKKVCCGYYYKQTGIANSGDSGELLMDFDGDLRIATYSCRNGYNSADSVFIKISNNDDFIIQQYTGLNDKNGKEIYEGDIIKSWYNEVVLSIVEWDNYNATFYAKQTATPRATLTHANYFKISQVVGNIFENHELLKQSE